MIAIRYFAAGLLLLTGILHVSPVIKNPSDPAALPMLVFGIAYFAIAVLLFLDIRFSKYLGLIFPLRGLAIGFGVVGVENWNTMLTFLFLIDAVVVLCSLLLILRRRPVAFRGESGSAV